MGKKVARFLPIPRNNRTVCVRFLVCVCLSLDLLKRGELKIKKRGDYFRGRPLYERFWLRADFPDFADLVVAVFRTKALTLAEINGLNTVAFLFVEVNHRGHVGCTA